MCVLVIQIVLCISKDANGSDGERGISIPLASVKSSVGCGLKPLLHAEDAGQDV